MTILLRSLLNINQIQIWIIKNIQDTKQRTSRRMRQKIRYDLLYQAQKLAFSKSHPIHHLLYETSYKYIEEMKSQVLKPFSSVCIHGNFPQLIIPQLTQNTQQLQKINLHSNIYSTNILKDNRIRILNSEVPFTSSKQSEEYDLIISCLEGHHYDMSTLMSNYLLKLKPDGAVIGCCWAQNTLKQLKWAYMLAQNQRSGGISPKVFGFPGLGSLGHSMTTSQMKMPTIIVRDFEIEVDSVVDILTLLQIFGQSGSLQGRRKGIYKDVLLATAAYYDSEFSKGQQEKKSVTFSLQMGLFIGWKQHESQPKPLKPKKVITNSFFAELSKTDSSTKIYSISQQSDEPTQINIEEFIKDEPEQQK